ncbi:RING-type E3 ubiquitin transferase, partial [Sarracenia purpurea var. burkii]
MEVAELCSQQSYLECVPTEEPICDAKTTSTELLDRGYMQYGYGFGLLTSHLQYRSLDSLVIFLVTICASFDSCPHYRQDSALELHAAMRSLIVVIVIARQ